MQISLTNVYQGEGLMKKAIATLMLSLIPVLPSYAASWTELQDNQHAKLMLDRDSIATSGKYQKTWVKIQYKKIQQNLEYPDKSYNNAKLLWYFNCEEQKSASIQVYQLLNAEQIFSAAIDVKRARFIEPVPETEIDLAMQYVCKKKVAKAALAAKQEAAKISKAKTAEQADAKKTEPVPPKAVVEEKPVKAAPKPEVAAVEEKIEDKEKEAEKEAKKEKKKHEKKKHKKKRKKRKSKKHAKVHWSDESDLGPAVWGELAPEFTTCSTGQNQSPIDVDKTVSAKLKPLKTFQRFPAKDIQHNGHTIQANFKSGNVLAVDGVMYQMKQVHFHAPSENTINGQSFPLEAHFVHTDPKGNLAVLAVMFEEGAENKGLKKLWKQLPKRKGRPKKLKTKVLPGDLLPKKKGYYRYSGSLTTPPCTEGVIWLIKKVTISASKAQIDAFAKVIGHSNNRPVQSLNGRFILGN